MVVPVVPATPPTPPTPALARPPDHSDDAGAVPLLLSVRTEIKVELLGVDIQYLLSDKGSVCNFNSVLIKKHYSKKFSMGI